MLLIWSVISLLLSGIFLAMFRDIRIPPVILSLEFTFLYFLEYFIGYEIYSEKMLYGYFIIGTLVFCMGYIIFSNVRHIKLETSSCQKVKYFFYIKKLNLFLLAGDLYCLYELKRMLSFARTNYVSNFFTTIHRYYVHTWAFGRVRFAICAIVVIVSIMYFMFERSKKIKWTLIHAFILAITYSLMTTGRTQTLLPIISVCVIWMYSKKNINIKSIFKIFVIIVAFLAFFLVIATQKDFHSMDENLMAFFLSEIKIYLCSSMPAFIHWVQNTTQFLNGQNTFRFFYALLGRENVVSLAQEFVLVDDLYTNIFTFYQFYAADFGLFFALAIQFILGGSYSLIYYLSLKFKDHNFFFLFSLYAMLYFPLVLQYMGDFYMALLSSWIQLTFWLWFFSRKWIIRTIYE